MDFSVKRRVEFRDTDAAGIVHFSAFFPMMEAAEHALLRSLGIPIMPTRLKTADGNETPVTWPRVAAHCDYVSAARFEDELCIRVKVAKIGSSSVQYQFEFSRDDDPVATATMTAVCCQLIKDASTGETQLKKVVIPEAYRSLLKKHAIDASS